MIFFHALSSYSSTPIGIAHCLSDSCFQSVYGNLGRGNGNVPSFRITPNPSQLPSNRHSFVACSCSSSVSSHHTFSHPTQTGSPFRSTPHQSDPAHGADEGFIEVFPQGMKHFVNFEMRLRQPSPYGTQTHPANCSYTGSNRAGLHSVAARRSVPSPLPFDRRTERGSPLALNESSRAGQDGLAGGGDRCIKERGKSLFVHTSK